MDTYKHLFIFSVANMRRSKLKDIRNACKHSRVFFGKNKVMVVALGGSDEYKDNLHQVSKKMRGEVGLLYTNRTKEEVNEWFTKYTEMCGGLWWSPRGMQSSTIDGEAAKISGCHPEVLRQHST